MIFGTAVSGIQCATHQLEVIGNNIANAPTIGFKGSRANFGDIYNLGNYGGSMLAIGQGARLMQVEQMFGQGDIEGTNNSLDLAVSGSGFFTLSQNGARLYTRAGAFGADENGYIINSSKQNLVGYLPTASGTIGSTIGNLQINTAESPPSATTTVSAGVNLQAGAKAPKVDWLGGATPAPDTYDFPLSQNIYDSLGNSHVLSMYFILADSTASAGQPNASTPPGQNNQWYVAFQIDNQNVPANVGTDNTSNLFRANFNPDGSFAGVADTSNNPLPANLIPLSMTLTNGANPLNFNVDLSDCTQFGSSFSTLSNSQNGYTTGRLNNLTIGKDGTILGIYTNGQSVSMGQVLLTNFANPNGLQNVGNTTWSQTADSGQPLTGIPGSGSLGFIQSGALENSNVDLTSELVSLITAQRNFQANAKTITTADAVTQAIINIR